MKTRGTFFQRSDHPSKAGVERESKANLERGLLANVQLEQILRASPLFEELFAHAAQIDLPDWYIAGGCVTQTVWNWLKGVDPEYGIRGIDFIYFRPDSSAEKDAQDGARIRGLFSALTLPLDVTNQARVHEWFPEKFGVDIPPHPTAEFGISTWIPAFAVGVRLSRGQLIVHAPYGLNDLFNRTLRPNKKQMPQQIYELICQGVQTDWPEVTIQLWSDEGASAHGCKCDH